MSASRSLKPMRSDSPYAVRWGACALDSTLVVIDHNLLAAAVALELISLMAVAAWLYLPSKTREVVVSAFAAFERCVVIVVGLLACRYFLQVLGTQFALVFYGCLLLVWAVYANVSLSTLAVRPCALQGLSCGVMAREVNKLADMCTRRSRRHRFSNRRPSSCVSISNAALDTPSMRAASAGSAR